MILRSLLLRPLLRRPVRFLVTVFGIAVGIASVVSTFASTRAALASMREGVLEIAGRTRLEITKNGGVDERVLKDLREISRDAEILPVIEEFALFPELGDTVRVLGLDLLVDGSPRGIEYRGQDSLDEDIVETVLKGEGVLISPFLAEKLGLEPGAKVSISIRSKLVPLTVAGVLKPPRFSSAWDRLVVMDIAKAQELFGKLGRLDRVELFPRTGISNESVLAGLRQVLANSYRIREPRERADETSRMASALEFNLTALAGVSLLVGGVLVATTLATSVVQRRFSIALLRSLGASPSQIAKAIFVEATLIGALGGTLGIFAGWWGASISLASVRSTMAAAVQDAPSSGVSFLFTDALIGMSLALSTSWSASILPLVEALKTPPIQNLRTEKPVQINWRNNVWPFSLAALLVFAAGVLANAPPLGDLPIAAVLAALCLFLCLLVLSSPLVQFFSSIGSRAGGVGRWSALHLAASGLSAGRRRASWAAGAIGVAFALAVAMAVMVDSFRTTVVDWAGQALRADLWIRPLSPDTGIPSGRLDPELVKVAERLYGRMAVDPYYETAVQLGGRPITLGAGALRVVQRHGGVPFLDGRDSRSVFSETLARRGAIINEPLANRFGLGKGDFLRFESPIGEATREIVGVFYDYSNHMGAAVIDLEDFLALFPDNGPEGIAVFLPAGTEAREAKDQLLASLEGKWAVEVMLNRDLREEVLAAFDRTFAVTTSMQVVASLVAVIAVLTVLFTLVNERRVELAVVRAIGGSRIQVGEIVIWEAGLMGMAGASSGLIVGLLVGWILVRVLNLQSFGWTLRFLPPWTSILMTLLFVLLACFVAGAIPAWAASRAMPREALHAE